MKNIVLILTCVFFLGIQNGFSQTRQLQLRGESEVKVAPDLAVLTLNVNAQAMEFSKTISLLTSREKDVLKKLEKIGFSKEKVKTSDFSVYENRVWWEGRNYDSGYVARQTMSLEFANSKEKIADILNAFSSPTTEVEISFSFTLSDGLRQKKSDEVIQLAIAEAKRKAQNIALASGVTLGKVLKIEYHVDLVGASAMPMMDYRMEAKMMSAGGPSEGFVAKEITMADGVVIFFEIE